MLTDPEPLRNLCNGIAPLGDLRDRVTLELISEIARPHQGLLASNLGKKASTNLGAIQAINREARFRMRFEAISNANAVHSLALAVINHAAALKSQTYLPKQQEYSQRRTALKAAIAAREPHLPLMPFDHLPPIKFALGPLEELVFSKLGLNGRPLAAMAQLSNAEHTFRTYMVDYDNLRTILHEGPPEEALLRYYALPLNGGVDKRFLDLCDAFVEVLDHLMFFSGIIGEDALDFAGKLRSDASRGQRKALPRLNATPVPTPELAVLLPNRTKYRGWLAGYPQQEPARQFLWRRWLPFIGK